MIALSDYSKVKDLYCLCYFGPNRSYLAQLKLLVQVVRHNFPGIDLCLGCRDDYLPLLRDLPNVMKLSEIKLARANFGYMRELTYNGHTHPVLDFIEESKIIMKLQLPTPVRTTKCTIISKGDMQVMPLSAAEIDKCFRLARDRGYEANVDGPIADSGLVIGVESYELFEAANLGYDTVLIESGHGTGLYKKCFPKGEIMYR